MCGHHSQLCWLWWSYAWKTTGPPAYRTHPADSRGLNALSVASGLKHTCTNIILTMTGLGCQASKHKTRGNSTIDDTESMQKRPECQVTGRTQCNKDDDVDQHVHKIFRQLKCCSVHETFCEVETSQTLFPVEIELKHVRQSIADIFSNYVMHVYAVSTNLRSSQPQQTKQADTSCKSSSGKQYLH